MPNSRLREVILTVSQSTRLRRVQLNNVCLYAAILVLAVAVFWHPSRGIVAVDVLNTLEAHDYVFEFDVAPGPFLLVARLKLHLTSASYGGFSS